MLVLPLLSSPVACGNASVPTLVPRSPGTPLGLLGYHFCLSSLEPGGWSETWERERALSLAFNSQLEELITPFDCRLAMQSARGMSR